MLYSLPNLFFSFSIPHLSLFDGTPSVAIAYYMSDVNPVSSISLTFASFCCRAAPQLPVIEFQATHLPLPSKKRHWCFRVLIWTWTIFGVLNFLFCAWHALKSVLILTFGERWMSQPISIILKEGKKNGGSDHKRTVSCVFRHILFSKNQWIGYCFDQPVAN